MKIIYTFRYVCADFWHKTNRPFTIINLIGIGISTAVLVLLLGSFFAFRKNSEKDMDKLGLSIEVTNREAIITVSEAQKKSQLAPDKEIITSTSKVTISPEMHKKLQQLPGAGSVHLWTPTVFLFYTDAGRLYDGAEGRTIDLNDALFESIRDFRHPTKPVFFAPKHYKNPPALHDEIGIIVPFILLKKLDYLSSKAEWNKPETWKDKDCAGIIPDKLRIRIKGEHELAAIDVEIPIVAVISEIEGGRYLVTKDFYRIFGSNWRNDFRGLIRDRQGNLLFTKEEYPNTPELQTALKKLPMTEETHATVYAQTRSKILPLIKEIRNLDMRADCALEHHISDYQQQESFFLMAAGGVCLVMFFFSGVILFATFHALVLRKLQEIGLLKACGSSETLAYRLFALQAVIISGMAGLLGLLIGVVTANQVTKIIQEYAGMDTNTELFYLPIEYMVGIVLFGMLFCLLVTFFPVKSAVKIDADLLIRG